jgi:hypothetical protein
MIQVAEIPEVVEYSMLDAELGPGYYVYLADLMSTAMVSMN